MTRADAKKAAWLTEFQWRVIALDSKHTGKIEWTSATHFYNTEPSAEVAARRYVENRK